jgi:tetratricopeptide (TPR) repeat protein
MAITLLAQTHMANDHSPVKDKSRLPIVAGTLAAIAAASPCFFSRPESLRAAIAGCARDAGWLDRLAAAGFALAGLPGADAARALCVAAPVFAGFLAIAWISQKLPAHFQNRIRWGLLIASLLVAGLGVFEAFQASRSDIRDIRLLAPIELLEKASEGRVFLNAPALSAARLLSPDLASRAPDLRSIRELAASAVRWREENRSNPFQSILLAVPLEDSRPLVEMLNASPEWHLAKIDNQGLLYRRGKETENTSSADPIFSNNRDSALHDAQTAMVMHFLGKNKDAREWMTKARQIAPRDPLVLTQSATLAAALKQWPTTKKEAELALKEDPSSTQARYLLVLALLETGNISGAANESATLSAKAANTPSVLWLQARISREANDPTNEIAALEKLLTLAQKQKEEPTIIHIHLAQAWAKRGFATQALENYNAALKGTLTPAQRAELENAKGTIQDRAPRH